MSSGDVLEKIRSLVARAMSPYEEEARTAAVQACRLILEHKITLALPHEENEGGEVVVDLWKGLGDLLGNLADRAAPVRSYPFDPFTAPFRVVAEFARKHSIEMTDRGAGRYAATVNGRIVAGSWHEVVRAVFSHIERPRASEARGTSRR